MCAALYKERRRTGACFLSDAVGFFRLVLKNMPAACSGKERKQTLPYILFHYTQFFFENQDKNLNSY